jgi:hypothetical protein
MWCSRILVKGLLLLLLLLLGMCREGQASQRSLACNDNASTETVEE